uniref:BAR domain-containing protein n=1 Tax=Haemonchus contortus TaxID=6289 RepID=A0A7I4Z425_HAECO
MDLERLYREDHTFFKVHRLLQDRGSPGGQFHDEIDFIIFNRRFCLAVVAVVPWDRTIVSSALDSASQCVERDMKFRKRSPNTSTNWDHFDSLASKWEDSVIDNIDEEYNRLVDHLHDSARKAEMWYRASYRQSPTNSKRAKLCREAIKEDLKEGRAAVMDEATEAGKGILKARRSFANYKTKMTSLRCPDEAVTASRRTMEKVIYDFNSDLFDSLVHLSTYHLRQDEYIAPSVLS